LALLALLAVKLRATLAMPIAWFVARVREEKIIRRFSPICADERDLRTPSLRGRL
jgi:hypothetical protein